jgi:prevent-host-death family protein
MADVSSRDLRNHTADVLRRVEAGERIRINLNRRPVAELVPLGRPQWTSGASIERVLREAPADRGLLDDLAGHPRADGRGAVSTAAVLDTSVFVAVEQGRGLERSLPDQVGVSVVTLAELELGVLMASDADVRALRLATLLRVREQAAGLPIDERVSSAYARLAAGELSAGRKPRVNDTWIAATALVHDAQVWTQEADFTAFGALEIVRV